MKSKILLVILIVFSLSAYSQKGKKPTPTRGAAELSGAKAPAVKKTALAKAENIAAELLEKKDSYKFYMLAGKDTVLIKSISGRIGDNVPTNCKITPFTAKGTKLYSVSWIEKSVVGDPKKKLENITQTHTEIWDIANKARILENIQTVNNISEIVFLDPNNTASKTVEKIRRDGFEFTLLPDGDIILKNKTQEDRLTFDAAQKKFVGKKK